MKLSEKNICDNLMRNEDQHHIKQVLGSWTGIVQGGHAGHAEMKARLNYIQQNYSVYEFDEQPGIDAGFDDDSTTNSDLILCNKYRQLAGSAKRRGKEFNLSINDVRNLLKRKTCFYTGVEFSDAPGCKRTIDRIDETKGYVNGNVVAVTERANHIKNNLFENKASPMLTTMKQMDKMLSTIKKLKK